MTFETQIEADRRRRRERDERLARLFGEEIALFQRLYDQLHMESWTKKDSFSPPPDEERLLTMAYMLRGVSDRVLEGVRTALRVEREEALRKELASKP